MWWQTSVQALNSLSDLQPFLIASKHIRDENNFFYKPILNNVEFAFTERNCEKWIIGGMVRVFTNGPGNLGSIPGRVIPKTQKMVLDASLLNTQHYKVRIKGKWINSRKVVMSSPIPRRSSYWKGSLRVTLD